MNTTLIIKKENKIYFLLSVILLILLSYLITVNEIYVLILILSFISIFLLKHEFVLYLLLIFGMLLSDRSFAYLHIPNTKIYITEIVILVTLGILFFNKLVYKNRNKIVIPLKKYLIPYCCFGLISLFRGMHYGLDAVRDFVLVYYALMFVITLYFIRDEKSLNIFIIVFLLGCLVSSVAMFLGSIFQYGLGVLHSGRMQTLYLSMSVVFLFATFPLFRYKLLSLLIIILETMIVFYYYQSRASWLSLLGALIVSIVLMMKYNLMNVNQKMYSYLFVTMCFMLSLILIFQLSFPFLEEHQEKFMSIYKFQELRTSSQANAQLRINIARDLFSETFSSTDTMLFGTAMGKTFLAPSGSHLETYISGFGTDPHNSHLAILYRTGVFGFIFYILIILKTISQAISYIRNKSKILYKYRLYILGFLGMFIVVLIYSSFVVVLEGPQGGIFFWITLGCLHRTMFLARKNYLSSNSKVNSF